jgi:hypothetical protein
VTPIRPTDWKLIFDGKTVTLHPSIGNWSFPCQSHYWIRGNRVKWARQWTQEQIEDGRMQDRHSKHDYFAVLETPAETSVLQTRHQQDYAKSVANGQDAMVVALPPLGAPNTFVPPKTWCATNAATLDPVKEPV